MTCYYSVITRQKCSSCGEIYHSAPHPQMNVEAMLGEQKKIITYEELTYRYMRWFNLNEEQVRDVMPRLPYEYRYYDMRVPRCQSCAPSHLGVESDAAMPPMLPIEVPLQAGKVHGGNFNLSKPKPSTKAKPKPTLDSLFDSL
jgi:hypothetical protein